MTHIPFFTEKDGKTLNFEGTTDSLKTDRQAALDNAKVPGKAAKVAINYEWWYGD
jgi:hypothetical protein